MGLARSIGQTEPISLWSPEGGAPERPAPGEGAGPSGTRLVRRGGGNSGGGNRAGPSGPPPPSAPPAAGAAPTSAPEVAARSRSPSPLLAAPLRRCRTVTPIPPTTPHPALPPSGDAIVKLADFGLSCFYSRDEPQREAVGSPFYMAPEMVTRAGYGEPSREGGQ